MDGYISREAVFQVVHGIARGIATKDTEALKAKDMKTLYKIKGAKEILDSVDTNLSYIPTADVQPVKRGRWIISNLYAQCSECSVAYDLDTFQRLIPMNENVPRHCSYCGARMEQED